MLLYRKRAKECKLREITHQFIVRKAAQISHTQHGEVILRNKFWLETNAAGRISDNVLRDWLYHNLPRSIWCLRRLTDEILSTPKEDELKLSFLLNWASHYLTDPLWVDHLASKYLPTWQDLVELDTIIEVEMEGKVLEILKESIEPWMRGYWSGFWKTALLMERRTKDCVHMLKTKTQSVKDFHMENIRLCIKVFASYLKYLDYRRALNKEMIDEILRKRDSLIRRDSTVKFIGCADSDAHKQNAWVIALNIAMNTGRNVRNMLTYSDREKCDLVVTESDYIKHPINIVDDRIILSGNEHEIGNVVDFYLDVINAKFGTYKNDLKNWVGTYLLKKNWNGQEIADKIYSEKLFRELVKIRGYERIEIMNAPKMASEEAQEDRKMKNEEEKAWIKKWSKVLKAAM